GIFNGSYDDEYVGAEVDLNNLETTMNVSPIPITKIHKDHPKDKIIADINSATQTRRMTNISKELAMVNYRKKQRRTNHKDYQNYLFFCFLSQIEPKKVTQALIDPSWIEAINKEDERGIVVRNKARLVAQGYTQEEGINYDKVFALVARIEAIIQDKYVADILKKFDFVTMKIISILIETNKALLKDEEAEDVDVHLYKSMIGSLMYLTTSRPDIIFDVCACARDSPFDLEAFLDSDYVRASIDRKSTTGGCQFLGKRLISWQCKKQTVVANSTTEAEYVAAANCCGQVLWIQNQMLDYGFNFMNTKIYIDNESTICIVKNPVFHSKTKHIEIRHHFIRDSYEKKLIQVIKIHTDHNVADLLTKAFDDRQNSMVEFGEMRQLEVLRYAFTKNPIIYVSLIKKFWHTATVRTVDNGEQEINVTVDGKEFTITEASVMRHLQFAELLHDEESVKKQKLKENDAEKEELRACLDIVSGDEIAMDFESLATKYPIIDWKTHILTENMMYYQISL
ncbi:putative ribonuclease H-like domain-containing protein, partial [Tanacetum coccineum]